MSTTIDELFGEPPKKEEKDEKKEESPEEPDEKIKEEPQITITSEQPEPTPKGGEENGSAPQELSPASSSPREPPGSEKTPVTDISDIFGEAVPTTQQEEVPEEVPKEESITVETPPTVTVEVPEETSDVLTAESTPAVTPATEVEVVPQQKEPTPEPVVTPTVTPVVTPAVTPGGASIDDIFGPSTPAPTESVQVETVTETIVQPESGILMTPTVTLDQGLARTELPPPPLPKMPDKFDTSPEPPGESRTFMVYGEKGDSKTTTALSFPGKMAALSFDHKTVEIWAEFFENDPRITVYDAIRYMDYSSPDAWLMSSEITLVYINIILDELRMLSEDDYPDWIVIDGLEEYTKVCEMVMRYRNGIRMTQGVEWGYWKERRLYLKQIHLKCMSIAKRGIIYTTFAGRRETIKDNKIVETMKQPKWVDVMKDQTDIVIAVESKQTAEGKRFFATVESSKYRLFPTGLVVDITVPPGQKPNVYDILVKEGVGGK